jgi:hypothetical protein
MREQLLLGERRGQHHREGKFFSVDKEFWHKQTI